MPRVPIITQRVPQRTVARPVARFNPAEMNAEARKAQTIAEGVQQIGGMVAQYAQQHKEQDIATDQAAFNLYVDKIMQEADNLAAYTQNPEEVNRIHENAKKSISDYVSNNGEGTGGPPNFKWRDHKSRVEANLGELDLIIQQKTNARVLDIYRADSRAKHQRLASEFISSENEDGLKNLGTLMNESGLYTPEEVNKFVSNGLQSIAQQSKARGYNIINERMAELKYNQETGTITNDQEIDELNLLMSDAEKIHEDYQPVVRSRIYSRLSQAYKREKTNLFDGLKRISKGMDNGSYDRDELNYFLGAHVKDYDDLVLVSQQARKALEEFKPTATSKGRSTELIQAVDSAIKGERNGEPYTITDAIKDMKDSESPLAPMGMVILGAAMMAPDSGVDEEGLYYNWMVEEDTFGWKNNPVKVSKDSRLASVVDRMGRYVVAGDDDTKWIEKTFFRAVDIGQNPDLTEEEKDLRIKDLFKGKARILAEEVRAPQQNQNSTASGSDLEPQVGEVFEDANGVRARWTGTDWEIIN